MGPEGTLTATTDLVAAGSSSTLAAALVVFLISIFAVLTVVWIMSNKHSVSIEKIFDRLANRDDSLAKAIDKLGDAHISTATNLSALNENIKQGCMARR